MCIRDRCACVDALRGAADGGGADGADELELVEQAVLNLLLCAAAELQPTTRRSALEIVRASLCAAETVDSIAAALADAPSTAPAAE